MHIIGITGTLGAGKGTISDYLQKKGYLHYSVKDFLTDLLIKNHQTVNRDTLLNLANDLRQKHGPSYVTDQLYNQAVKKGQNSIIESIRNPKEAESLKSKADFYLLAIDAKPRIRYDRIVKRGSLKDKITYKKFIDQEKNETENKASFASNLPACIAISDYQLTNNTSLPDLYRQIDSIMEKIAHPPYVRPSWDDYFMEIMDVVGKRSTCDRGRTACVIVKNKQILVTGYSGAPSGLPHCDEEGHTLKKTLHENGDITEHCVRTVHAEQNAICQAAKTGVSIAGATIYIRMTPCRTCAMLLINCGVERIYCERKYHAGAESESMLKLAGIKLDYKFNEVQQYTSSKPS